MTRTPALWLAILGLAACSARWDERTGDDPSQLPSDTLVTVGEYSLHLRVMRGNQPITVVFEAGGAADLTSWASVPDSLADRTGASVVAYDRAGLGRSDLGPPDLTPEVEIGALRSAMEALELPEATIVVGHSYGAMMALLHAELAPEAVNALVLVDPMNPRFVAAVGDWLESTVPAIPDPTTNREHAILRMARTMDSLSSRLLEVEPGLGIPMWIVSAGEDWWGPADVERAWTESHEAMAAAHGSRTRSIAEGAAHDIPSEAPEAILAAVAAAIDTVIRSQGSPRDPRLRP